MTRWRHSTAWRGKSWDKKIVNVGHVACKPHSSREILHTWKPWTNTHEDLPHHPSIPLNTWAPPWIAFAPIAFAPIALQMQRCLYDWLLPCCRSDLHYSIQLYRECTGRFLVISVKTSNIIRKLRLASTNTSRNFSYHQIFICTTECTRQYLSTTTCITEMYNRQYWISNEYRWHQS
jgi:hypothetical protein